MYAIAKKFICIIFLLSFLSSCATTSLVDTWRNPNMSIEIPHKILVVGIFKSFSKRQVFEDILASDLKLQGDEAISSHTLISTKGKVGREALEKAVKETGADAVITMKIVRVEEQTVTQPGYIDNYPDYWYPPAFPSWNMYDYYGSSYYEPPTSYTYEVEKIQINLFDSRASKLIWAATVRTSEPGNIVAVSKDIANIVVRSLKKAGLI